MATAANKFYPYLRGGFVIGGLSPITSARSVHISIYKVKAKINFVAGLLDFRI
jgi:hypothetical protein